MFQLKATERALAEAQLLGWGTAAGVQVLALAGRLPGPPVLWLQTQVFALGQLAAVALACTALAVVRDRLWPANSKTRLALDLAALTAALACLLEEDLEGPVSKLPGNVPAAVTVGTLALLVAAVCLAALWVGTLCARPRWRVLGVALACAVVAINARVYPMGYAGLHALAVGGAALFAANCYRGAEVVASLARRPLSWATGALLALPALVVRPSNEVKLQLSKQPAAVVAPLIARLGAIAPSPVRRVPVGQEAWFRDRNGAGAAPATAGLSRHDDQIVLLVGVDALRADVLADERRRALLPELFRLRDESVWFTQARGTGSSTVVSMASVFSGLHYSQLYWKQLLANNDYVFPHADPRPRVPELLTQAQVHTFVVDGMGHLRNEFGLARGFSDETHVPRSRNVRGDTIYPAAPELMEPFLAALRADRAQPRFGFVHLMDGHAPYSAEGDSAFERYLNGLCRLDGELARLRRFLDEQNLSERTTLVVFADHGEAFGEHGLTRHSRSLYEVMVRVPVLIRRPGSAARRVSTPVSLIDLAPTLLDLFGLPTPGRMMGESLVPFLLGEDPVLTRPIVLEGRLMRGLVDRSGLKIIHDTRGGTVELFDLARDPGETKNLFDDREPASQELLDVVSTFFAVHTYRAPGYEVPYRKW